jgi:hypothetical protein
MISSSVSDKCSSASFNTSECVVALSTDLSSQTTTNPLTTSVPLAEHPDISLGELVGNGIGVTHPSKSQSSGRFESELELYKK